MFLTERRRQRITKDNKSVSTRKETYNKPGSEVTVYQLQTAQPGLAPQLSGKITSALIWAA